DARARGHRDDADLHPSERGAVEGRVLRRSSAGERGIGIRHWALGKMAVVRRLALLALPAALLSGCGNSRVFPPDVAAPQPPQGRHLAAYPRSGVSVVIPDNWRAEEGASPLVASIASGTATVAIWR